MLSSSLNYIHVDWTRLWNEAIEEKTDFELLFDIYNFKSYDELINKYDINKIFSYFIEEWMYNHAKSLVKNYEWPFNNEVALDISNKFWIWLLLNNLSKFRDLWDEITITLIKLWYWYKVLEFLHVFKNISWNTIELLICSKENWVYLPYILWNINSSLHKYVAIWYIKRWYWETILNNIHDFWYLDKEVAILLINNWFSKDVYLLIWCFYMSFEEYKEIIAIFVMNSIKQTIT